jgi:hypothetical protein
VRTLYGTDGAPAAAPNGGGGRLLNLTA